MNLRKLVALLPLLIIAAGKPAFDPRQLKTAIAGPPSEVLVLGTPHLSELPAAFTPASLAPVLDRLAAWKPDVITIESLSGSDCEFLAVNRELTSNSWDTYCWDTKAAQAATGLTVAQAMLAIEKRLGAWRATPTAVDRRQLASLFLAANDRTSAQVQWLRLPIAERHAGDGLNAELVAILDKPRKKSNENVDIAAALAVRLGLERVYPADDHSSDTTIGMAPEAQGKAVEAAWQAQGMPVVRATMNAKEKALGTPAATLDLYRFFNTTDTGVEMVRNDMGAAVREPSPQHYGRWYVGWWEVRNLRMVANIRASFVTHPGARVLVIVGATHKPYFDAYLDMMQDVHVADAEKVLR
ncbi:TraB/GumN family protein [Sphingomonas antarctica]|uniref:DUF5694 domain-containing protein n=1 Tax=Sphingomonas antarctica TaxID=2040274 RepID=UPI0039E7A800